MASNEPFLLGDVFIGNFRVSQAFAARPEIYSQRYKLRGHNGVDFACPTNTPILAAADGFVSEASFEAGGYGNYIKIVHNGYFTIYAHLNDRVVNFKDKVYKGQLIGHSNNTGFSDGAHLHFGVAPCDANGLKTELNNGFKGYIDPMGSRCRWQIKNLTAPVMPSLDSQPDVPVKAKDFVDLVTKSTNWDVLSAYFKLNEVEKITAKMGERIIERLVKNEEEKQRLSRENETLREELKKYSNPPVVVTTDKTYVTPNEPMLSPSEVPDIPFPPTYENGTTDEQKSVLQQDVVSLFNKFLQFIHLK